MRKISQCMVRSQFQQLVLFGLEGKFCLSIEMVLDAVEHICIRALASLKQGLLLIQACEGQRACGWIT